MAGDGPAIFRIFAPVGDFEAAKLFYERLFDAAGTVIHHGRLYFYCGPVIFAVIEKGGEPIGDHVYFAVADVDAAWQRAKDLNCLETDDVHGAPSGEVHVRPWGERSFYARDPWGNGLCFVDESTLFTGKR